MKKNITIILIFLIITIYLFLYHDLVSITVINTSYIFIKNILPFMLSFYIISNIFINYNLPYYIAKLFNNNLYIFILIISFFIGCPSNIIFIKNLLDKKIISIKEANKYITCTYFINPLFLYSMLSSIFNIKIALFIIINLFISNIIIYLIKPIKSNNISYIKSDNLANTINKSIKDISIVLLNIYITIIIFNILIIFIPSILNNICGLIEITTGLNYLLNNNMNYIYNLLLCIIYISFGGLSLHMQIKSVLIDTNINYNLFLKSRFYQTILMLLVASICLQM